VLSKLNENADWRGLFGNKSKRLKDMEMILRFFAFYFGSGKYASPMKDFLNKYMARNRQLAEQSEDDLTKTFQNTVAIIAKAIGHRAFRPERAVNAAVIDSVMTGIARRLDAGPIKSKEQLVQAYKKLLRNKRYRDAVETGTSQEAKVKMRITKAAKAFSLVK
jgi:hypothetical protein